MRVEVYSEVALANDMPDEGLRRGDIVTIVDRVSAPGGGDGYLVEVFNAVGQTINVVPVAPEALTPLAADQVLSVRQLAPTGVR